MNKELTPLEALEKLWQGAINPYEYLLDDEPNNIILKETIEKALKEHELMKQTRIIVANKNISDEDLEKLKNQRMFVGSLEQSEIKVLFDEETKKKLKALEIIKNKFHLHIVKDEKNGNFYAMVVFAYKNLPQYCIYETHDKEEYDLLKEVLL